MYMYNDGGRAVAGYKGQAGDCVARAIAIASGRPYAEIYARLAEGTGLQRMGKNGKRSASTGEKTVRDDKDENKTHACIAKDIL